MKNDVMVYFYHASNKPDFSFTYLKKFLSLMCVQVNGEWSTDYKVPFPEIVYELKLPDDFDLHLSLHLYTLQASFQNPDSIKCHQLLCALDAFACYHGTHMSLRRFAPHK